MTLFLFLSVLSFSPSLLHSYKCSLSLSHSHALPLPLSHTHFPCLSHTLSLPVSHTHTHTHTLSPSLSHTHILSLPLSLAGGDEDSGREETDGSPSIPRSTLDSLVMGVKVREAAERPEMGAITEGLKKAAASGGR